MNTIILNNGVKMPQMGLGTYLIPKDKLSYTIGLAYDLGYRLFDTAWRYHNEKEIAQALKENHISREDVFITSKFNITGSYKSLCVKDYLLSLKIRPIKSVLEQSFNDLNTDYIDLYLMHWPYPMWKAIYEQMSSFYVQKRFKAIGVCSFLQPHIEALKDNFDITPAVNQFEISPLNTQKSLIKYCQSNKIQVEAMSTFSHYRSTEARPEILQNTTLMQIAEKHNKSVVQVVLRWMLQQNIVIIPKTWDPNYLKENISIFDFELDKHDMSSVDSLDGGEFLNYNPYKATQGYKSYFKKWKEQ